MLRLGGGGCLTSTQLWEHQCLVATQLCLYMYSSHFRLGHATNRVYFALTVQVHLQSFIHLSKYLFTSGKYLFLQWISTVNAIKIVVNQ